MATNTLVAAAKCPLASRVSGLNHVPITTRARPSWLRYLCLLAFVVKVLLPVGMMPARSADGTITLVLCTGHGWEDRSVPAEGDAQEETATWCPFSLLQAPVLPTTSTFPTPACHGEVTDPVPVALDGPILLDLDTHLPRGPPFIL